jgi:hypothetical protein
VKAGTFLRVFRHSGNLSGQSDATLLKYNTAHHPGGAMQRVRVAVAFAAVLTASHAFGQIVPTARPKVIYAPIVLSGDSMPGMTGTFGSFPYHSVINDADHIVFLGSNSPQGHSPNSIYISAPTGLSLVAQVGQDAPGYAEGVKILSFDINYHRANNNGQVVFESTLIGPGIDDTGIDHSNAFGNWFWSNGQLQKIYQFRTPAPGTGPGADFRTFGRTTINDLGHVAFTGDLIGANVNFGNDSAMWYGAPGNVQLLAREGAPAPGGVVYGNMQFDHPVLSPGGKVAFLTDLAGGGFFNRAIFAGTPDDLQLIAKSGDAAPGTSTTFNHIHGGWNTQRVNDRGDVFFASTLNDGSRGIWAGKAGNLTLVGQTGQDAPGLDGANYEFFYDLGLNERGDVTFRADVAGAQAIFAGRPNHVELIAAGGQRAPGTEDGVVYENFMTDPVINKDGQVAFFGYLTGPNSRGDNDYGIFATGHDGDLRLIARFGDEFEVAPGDVRTIAALSHAGVFGTHILSFNAQSDLVFLAKFTDGSEGIFTATVLPEPGVMVMLGVAGLMMLGRRRR